MPNSLAYMMLLAWPVIAVGLYRSLRLERAVIWSILGAYMLLPPVISFDPPLVPALDKYAIANLSAYAICVFMLGKRVRFLPASLLGQGLVVLMFCSQVLTAMTNTEPLVFPQLIVPGLGAQDAFAAAITQFIDLLPFMIARSLLSSDRAMRDILNALVVAGLIYSVPMLVEIRMSPQINTWIYGFFQHDFAQMVRNGGYRPMVFMPHGLWVAFFALMTLVAALALWRHGEPKRRGGYMVASGYLGMMLVLCKSAAVLVYALILVPVVRFFGLRHQLLLAGALALLAMLYPLLRGGGMIPVDAIVAQAEAINPDRAASLKFRLDNEEALLARAAEKPLFGWGNWGRNQIHDPITGKVTSTTDGRWIIIIGALGWAGYIGEFGLLTLSILMLTRESLRRGAAVSPLVGPVALILGFNMIDMLPNATLIPFTWVLAGAILGYAERVGAGQTVTDGAPVRIAADPVRPRTIL